MISLLDLAIPIAQRLDPEHAHGLALRALAALPQFSRGAPDARLRVSAFGLSFPNPVGLAAGFDKNAEVPDPCLRLGFGFVEVGTVTPRPQSGNPRPRMFRLPADEGLINRLGFNNEGFAAVRSAPRRARKPQREFSASTSVRTATAKTVSRTIWRASRRLPRTQAILRSTCRPRTRPACANCRREARLDDLLGRAVEARDRAPVRRPLLLKVAPDLSLAELDDVVAVARKRKLDGMIVSNTTVARSRDLRDPAASEAGGLSGKPLFALSTWLLSETFKRVEGAFPLIGVGGIDSEDAAWRKLRAGATLLQLYSGFTYKGLGLIGRINKGLAARISRAGVRSVIDVVGADAGR